MKPDDTCDQCREQLVEFCEGDLSMLAHQRVDQHLKQCADCSNALGNIWQLQNASSTWAEQRVPRWNKRQLFFDPSPWPARIQWFCTAGSLAMMIIVLFTLQQNGQPGPEQLAEVSELHERLDNLATQNEQMLAQTVARTRDQQISTNQFVARSLLDQSREERRDELSQLLLLIEDLQYQRDRETQQNLSYLIAGQIEDRRDIEALNQAFTQAQRTRLQNERVRSTGTQPVPNPQQRKY
jgi:hypothetical protein